MWFVGSNRLPTCFWSSLDGWWFSQYTHLLQASESPQSQQPPPPEVNIWEKKMCNCNRNSKFVGTDYLVVVEFVLTAFKTVQTQTTRGISLTVPLLEHAKKAKVHRMSVVIRTSYRHASQGLLAEYTRFSILEYLPTVVGTACALLK